MIMRRLQIASSVMVLGAVTVVGVDYFLGTPQSPPSSSILANASALVQNEPIEQNIFSSMLIEKLDSVIAEWSNLEIAVSVVDLGTGTKYNAGESDVTFRGASTTKLITAAAYLNEVDKGNASLTQRIDGVAANQLLKRMIQNSDNEAWASLINYLGDKEQDFADSIGLTSYTQNPSHIVNSSDLAKLLTLLYQDRLISTDSKELLFGFMEAANYTDLIKSALPSEATVFHKYGTLYGNLHDTAIVTYKGHSFALVIFTKNPNNTTDDYSERVKLIHQITQVILDDLAT